MTWFSRRVSQSGKRIFAALVIQVHDYLAILHHFGANIHIIFHFINFYFYQLWKSSLIWRIGLRTKQHFNMRNHLISSLVLREIFQPFSIFWINAEILLHCENFSGSSIILLKYVISEKIPHISIQVSTTFSRKSRLNVWKSRKSDATSFFRIRDWNKIFLVLSLIRWNYPNNWTKILRKVKDAVSPSKQKFPTALSGIKSDTCSDTISTRITVL